jgi:hypothetical protein
MYVHANILSIVQAADGRYELFKTTKKYGGDLGRRQHGFPTAAELIPISGRACLGRLWITSSASATRFDFRLGNKSTPY